MSISVTIDDASRLEQLVEELSAFADVRVEHDMAILCAVGDGLRRDPKLATRILGSLEHFPLRMVSQAASRRNVTVVLQDAVAGAAMNHLHDTFFARDAAAATAARPGLVSASLLIVGRGRMGRLVETLAPDYGFERRRHRRHRQRRRSRTRGRRPTWRSISRWPTRSRRTSRASPRAA